MMEIEKKVLHVQGPEMRYYKEGDIPFESYVVLLEPNQRISICNNFSPGYLEISYDTIVKMCSDYNVLL